MYIDPWVPLTLFRRWCLAAAVACEVTWVAGSGALASGTSACWDMGSIVLLTGLFWWAWLALYLFMLSDPVDDMTCGDFLLDKGDSAGDGFPGYFRGGFGHDGQIHFSSSRGGPDIQRPVICG